ncbi:MAG: IPT/TIG domain-containing protein [Myxococcaceae bacterium]
MSTRFVAALVFSLSVALLGCPGEDTSADAGTRDSGFDAGVDAGVPDAGQPDAGDLDGGVLPELAILKVLPPRAPTTGNVQVLLQGSGFVAGVAETATGAKQKTTLTVGSNPVIDFQIIDDQTLDMRVPPGQAGLTNITLKNDRGELVCKGCFTYFDEVFLTSVTPAEGPLAGGNEVTLKGGGFTPELQILFGQVSAAEFIFDSPNQIRVKVPRGTALDAVDVTAFSKNGVGVLRRAYRYQEDLRISAIAPLTGPLAGGTNITLTGKGFTGATGVTIGGVPATNVTVVSDTQLTATTPAVTAAGAFPVTVTTPRESWTVRDGFSYVSGAGFAVYGVFPHVGSQAGGNTVTLTGEGLDSGGLVVTIGGVAATVVAANESTARVTVPARTGGRKVDVTATAGAQTSTRPGGYTYRLELGSISPNRGPQLGGTVASIVGVALPADAEVFLGSSKAQVQMVGGETSIALTTPKGQGGRGTDVLVREAGDPENEAVLPGAFTFDEAISVGRVQPDRGAISGGTLVTVLGAGFGEGTLVSFAGQVAKDIKVIDAHTLTCRIPRGDTGAVDVGVRRLTESDTLEGGFSYYDPRSISGGLSGGPLTGTLNISVMDSTQGFFGLPVQQATVVLGLDPFTPFQGLTDGRGQLTFSDPALVKAQTVTVFKEGYESVTVTSVNATNLSVFVARTGGGEGSPGSPPPGVPPSIISGRVSGFKEPRPLGPNERLQARVFVAQTHLYGGTPYGARLADQRGSEKWLLTREDGEYLVLTTAGVRAVYAVMGVFNAAANSFEPYLMGVKRGVTVSPDNPATNQDIVLDMHLDMTVPVTVDQPLESGGALAPNELYAWLDLGAEGLIPNPHNWGTGTSPRSSISADAASFMFPSFPNLDGSNFVFMNLSQDPITGVYSMFYRRQPGDISTTGTGVTVGPMLPIPTLTAPTGVTGFNGTISWAVDPGRAVPDLYSVSIVRQTLFGDVTVWSMVLPGTETQVTLPEAAVQKLRTEEAGNTLFVQITSSRSPKFSYNQWTYDSLNLTSWSSYTVSGSEPFSP